MAYSSKIIMIGNQPPRRTGYARSSARLFPGDRDQRKRARQEAEALFAPKPPATETPPAGQPAPQSRGLETAPPPAPPEMIDPDPPKISAARVTRIRAWVRYGMTIGQVAQLCGVSIVEIERLLK
jgi:hypothetical protein